jgi:hypothetical protein
MAEQSDSANAGAIAHAGADVQAAAWRALPARLLTFLLVCDFALVAIFLALVFANMRRRVLFTAFDVGVEANIPTGYSAFQILLGGLIFLMLASRLVPQRSKVAELRRLWLVVGLGFVYLAFDEIAMVHERLPLWRLRVFNVPHVDPWMVTYLFVGVVLLLVLGKQILVVWRYWRAQVLLFFLGMAVYVSGGLVLEGVNYVVHFKGLVRYIQMAFEEGFEMLGVTIVVFAATTVLAWVMTAAPDSRS